MRINSSIVAASVLSSLLTALLLTGIDRVATARGERVLEELGPADALLLAGKDPLRLANADGRLSWSDQPGSRAYSLGTVHVGRILQALMASDKYKAEREEFHAARRAEGEEFEKRYKEMVEKIRGVDKDSPEFPALREELEAFQQEFTKWNVETDKQAKELVARHYQAAYSDLREAVEVVADRRKIDLVMRFIPPTEKLAPGDDGDIAQQLQARSFLRSPDSIDITEDIIAEMHLQAPKEQ